MTVAEFNAEFKKFKEAQPGWEEGRWTALKLDELKDQFFKKVLADVRRKALNEAASAIATLDITTGHNTRSAILNEAYSAILKLSNDLET